MSTSTNEAMIQQITNPPKRKKKNETFRYL